MSKIKKGFTLVELLIVIVVIGIISAIGVISFAKVQVFARDGERSSKIVAIVDSLEKYYMRNGEYPSCIELTQPPETVISNTLENLTTDILKAPTAPAMTNSINCSSVPAKGNDVFNYAGVSNENCSTSPNACQEWVLSYYDEANDTVKTIASKHLSTPEPAIALFIGSTNSCANNPQGIVYCWGKNGAVGRLGVNNTTASYTVPTLVYNAGLLSGKTIKYAPNGTYDNSCVITTDNEVYCWGEGSAGELGNNTLADSIYPVAVVDTDGLITGRTLKAVDTGYQVGCVIADGRAYCWGENEDGALGNGSTTDSKIPKKVTGVLDSKTKTVKAISVGGEYWSYWYWGTHVCAIDSDNLAYCWGYNDYGQVGDGTTTARTSPTAIGGSLTGVQIKSISAGGWHTCVIDIDDKAWCWGDNEVGQLGNGSTSLTAVANPQAVIGLAGKNVLSISAGIWTTCALVDDVSGGQVYCWGDNDEGQIGSGTPGVDVLTPTLVSGLSGKNIVSVAASDFHTCAVDSDNIIYCWGSNESGQLGNGSIIDSTTPVIVNFD